MSPNWKPLESKLGPSRCVGFMFMGRVNGVYHYKHGISRRYLLLDDDGRAYEAAEPSSFREIPFELALAQVEASLTDLGATLETAYDEAYLERKASALRAAGVDLLHIHIVPEDRTQ